MRAKKRPRTELCRDAAAHRRSRYQGGGSKDASFRKALALSPALRKFAPRESHFVLANSAETRACPPPREEEPLLLDPPFFAASDVRFFSYSSLCAKATRKRSAIPSAREMQILVSSPEGLCSDHILSASHGSRALKEFDFLELRRAGRDMHALGRAE